MLYGTITEFCTPQEVRRSLIAVCDERSALSLRTRPSRHCSAQSCPPAHGQYDSLLSAPPTCCVEDYPPSRRFCHVSLSDRVLTYTHRYEYLWEDGVRYKRPTKLPAPEYVDALMNWAQGLLDNEDVFPNKIGESHPIAVLRPLCIIID